MINIKKDALWKPLLRQFRRFVKRLSQANMNKRGSGHQLSAHFDASNNDLSVDSSEDKNNDVLICNNDSTDGQTPLLATDRLKIDGDTESVYDFAYEIYDTLNLPSQMRTQRNACAVLLLVQS